MSKLVILLGPVAVGKTTLLRALTARDSWATVEEGRLHRSWLTIIPRHSLCLINDYTSSKLRTRNFNSRDAVFRSIDDVVDALPRLNLRCAMWEGDAFIVSRPFHEDLVLRGVTPAYIWMTMPMEAVWQRMYERSGVRPEMLRKGGKRMVVNAQYQQRLVYWAQGLGTPVFEIDGRDTVDVNVTKILEFVEGV